MNLVDLVNFRNTLQEGIDLQPLRNELDKIIKQYTTVFDGSKFGLSSYIVLLRFGSYVNSEVKKFLTDLIKHPDVIRVEEFDYTWDGEVTQYRSPSGSTVQVLDPAPSSPFKSGTETWEFTKIPGGTRFTLLWIYQPNGFVSRISDAFGRRLSTRRAVQRSLRKVKTLLEQE